MMGSTFSFLFDSGPPLLWLGQTWEAETDTGNWSGLSLRERERERVYRAQESRKEKSKGGRDDEVVHSEILWSSFSFYCALSVSELRWMMNPHITLPYLIRLLATYLYSPFSSDWNLHSIAILNSFCVHDFMFMSDSLIDFVFNKSWIWPYNSFELFLYIMLLICCESSTWLVCFASCFYTLKQKSAWQLHIFLIFNNWRKQKEGTKKIKRIKDGNGERKGGIF
jgi:hypothetical protein